MSNSVSPPTTVNSRSPHVSPASATEDGPELEATLPENERPVFAPSQGGLKSWKELRRESRLTEFQMWMAPFPPPQAVLEYERALPGSWDRMLTMAEEAQAADIRNVQRKGEYLSRGFMRGQVFGFVAMLFAMGSALCCVRLNRPWVAAAFLSVTVMAAARSFFGSANDRSGTSHTTNDPTSEPASDA